ncbi:MAG: rod shape-determining protein MreD [Pseudomonadota bacterium]|nr:rod shape-determining protein MreD [Pseudomonadota bacterium]|tara:strand:- start:553 stop:1053 length:501 start_codon:yes stop_codon:yes gene_type:complete
MNNSKKNKLWIFLTLVISIFIDLYMFPDAVLHLKPLITLLVLIYWNMALPDKVGVSEALVVGLFLDILTGSILGLHALLFVFITYICQRFFYQFRVAPVLQQSVILFFLFFVFKIILAFDFINVSSGVSISDIQYLFNSLTFAFLSSLMWPIIFFILRELRRKKIK